MSEMNPVVHFEMPAEDRKRMSEFYTNAFGWKTQQLGAEMGNYVMATTTDTDENGMIKKPGAINGGGKVLGEPMEIPGIGIYVSFIDTEGNRASILQPTENM